MHPYFTLARGRASALAVALVAVIFIISPVARSFAGADNAAPTPRLASLDEIIAIGLRDNPSVKARRLAWKGAGERPPQASALPDPEIQFIQPIRHEDARLASDGRSIMLMQRFPWPGKLRLMGDIAKKEAEAGRAALDEAARDLVLEIKKAYYDIYYLDRAVALANERIRTFEHFSRAEMNDYAVGTAGFSDIVSAETRFADAENELILFAELRNGAAGRLNTLLGRDPELTIPPVEEPTLSEESSAMGALYAGARKHESIRSAGLMVERGALMERLAGFVSRPDFLLGLTYMEPGQSAMGEEDPDSVAVTFGLSIPLWGGKNRAVREEARLARAQSEFELASAGDAMNARVKDAYVNMKSNYRLARLYADSLIPRAEKLVETVEIGYRNGSGSIADLFEARVMLLNFSMAYHRAVADCMKDRAELERLTAGFALGEGVYDE